MQFKELKQGYQIYVFDRTKIEVSEPKVVNVSQPHVDSRIGSPTDIVVDITIESDTSPKTYVLKESSDVGYNGNLVISTTRDTILREVEAIKSQSEQILSQVDEHKAKVEKCKTILSEFNPIYKERKETEERFNKLESSIDDIKKLLSNMVITTKKDD
jgi:hypothetical protein